MALSVLGLLTIATYDILRSGLWRLQRWSSDVLTQDETAVAIALLSRDIRSAYLSNDKSETYFVGTPSSGPKNNRVDFTRRAADSETNQNPLWEVGYFLDVGTSPGQLDLCRRWQQTADGVPMEGGVIRHLLSGVRSLQIQYFDGASWSDQWNWNRETLQPMKGIRGLPLFVKVTMVIDSSNAPQQWIVPVMTAVLRKTFHAN